MTALYAKYPTKVIALVAVVVAVFGILLLRGLAGRASTKTASTETVGIITQSSGSSEPTSTNAKTVVEIEAPPNAAIVDPFRPVLTTSTTSIPIEGKEFGLGPPPGLIGTLPPLIPIVKPQVEATQQPKLTGIMSGTPPIGVFRVGLNDEIKRVGETLSDGFVVQSIEGQTAVLAKNKTILRLAVAPSP